MQNNVRISPDRVLIDMEIIEHTKYIKGELSKEEIDRLWIAFLNDPDRYSRFITLLHLERERVEGFKKP